MRRVADGREYTVHARKLVPFLEDVTLTQATSTEEEASPPIFEDDAGEQIAPKRKRGRPRKQQQQ